jgi:hypothetical protein
MTNERPWVPVPLARGARAVVPHTTCDGGRLERPPVARPWMRYRGERRAGASCRAAAIAVTPSG